MRNWPDEFDDIARSTASRSRRHCPQSWEEEDVAQELALHLISVASQYDPERGTHGGFANTTCKHKLISLMRQWQAAKRNGGHVDISLDEILYNRSGRSRPAEDVIQPRCKHGRDYDIDLHLDLADALNSAPLEIRLLAAALISEGNLSAATRSLGISRGKARTHFLKLKELMRDKGLMKYIFD